MNMKTVTLFAAIAALVSSLLSVLYMCLNAGLFTWSVTFSQVTNIINILISVAYAFFFFTLYNKQK